MMMIVNSIEGSKNWELLVPDQKFAIKSLASTTSTSVTAPLKPNKSHSAKGRCPSVGDQFWAVTRLLKFFGSSPLDYRKNDEDGDNVYYFKFPSGQAWFPFCSALFFAFLWVKYFVELVLDVPFIDDSFQSAKEYFFIFAKRIVDNHNSSGLEQQHQVRRDESISGMVSTRHVSMVVCAMVPLQQLILILSSWLSSSKFAQFLNSWNPIEEDYREIFFGGDGAGGRLCGQPTGTSKFINLVRWRNLLIFFYAVLPTLLIIPFHSYFFLHVERPLQIFFVNTMSLGFMMYPLLEDTKAIFTFKIVAEAFLQTKLQISAHLQNNGYDHVNADRVTAWRTLVCQLRSQCRLIGQFLQLGQLCHLMTSIVIITSMVYIVVGADYSHPTAGPTAAICFAYAASLSAQLCVKGIMADEVTRREKEIAEELLMIKNPRSDPALLAEIKFLHDLILVSPAKISLGNYVNLSKKLLLTVSSQVVTYIIVLLQLSQK